MRDLWDNIKHTNIHIIGVSEGEVREQGSENIFEVIIAENFPNMRRETDTQVQEVPNRINPERNTPRCSVIKMSKIKDKERILKAARKSSKLHSWKLPYIT